MTDWSEVNRAWRARWLRGDRIQFGVIVNLASIVYLYGVMRTGGSRMDVSVGTRKGRQLG